MGYNYKLTIDEIMYKVGYNAERVSQTLSTVEFPFIDLPPDSTCIFLEWKWNFKNIFGIRKSKKALQISVTPFSAGSEGH